MNEREISVEVSRHPNKEDEFLFCSTKSGGSLRARGARDPGERKGALRGLKVRGRRSRKSGESSRETGVAKVSGEECRNFEGAPGGSSSSTGSLVWRCYPNPLIAIWPVMSRNLRRRLNSQIPCLRLP